MPIIYGKSMPRLDHIMTHTPHQQFERGTNSQMISKHHHTRYLLSITKKKILLKPQNISIVVME